MKFKQEFWATVFFFFFAQIKNFNLFRFVDSRTDKYEQVLDVSP
jgi:hypothetical protein